MALAFSHLPQRLIVRRECGHKISEGFSLKDEIWKKMVSSDLKIQLAKNKNAETFWLAHFIPGGILTINFVDNKIM